MTEQSPNNDVIIQQEDVLGVITLNRPKALNALDLEVNAVISGALKQWHTDDATKAIVIKSSSSRAFCAGGDIKAIYQIPTNNIQEKVAYFELEYQLNLRIAQYPKPIIAFCQGITMGGGCGIAFHVSHPIAGDQIRLAMPETRIGLFPDIGASYVLPRLKDFIGYYLALTGNSIDQAGVIATGLMQYGADEAAWEAIYKALKAADWQEDAFATVNQVLEPLTMQPSMDASMTQHVPWIKRLFAVDSIEQLFEHCQEPCPEDEKAWREQQLDILKKACPWSLKLTLAALKRGEAMTLADVLKQDLRLAKHCLVHDNFYEGIRACLIDRDKPQWQPADYKQIDTKTIDQWFETDPIYD